MKRRKVKVVLKAGVGEDGGGRRVKGRTIATSRAQLHDPSVVSIRVVGNCA